MKRKHPPTPPDGFLTVPDFVELVVKEIHGPCAVWPIVERVDRRADYQLSATLLNDLSPASKVFTYVTRGQGNRPIELPLLKDRERREEARGYIHHGLADGRLSAVWVDASGNSGAFTQMEWGDPAADCESALIWGRADKRLPGHNGGRRIFIKENDDWLRGLARVVRDGVRPEFFDEEYWNQSQLIIWIWTRDKGLVCEYSPERVEFGFWVDDNDCHHPFDRPSVLMHGIAESIGLGYTSAAVDSRATAERIAIEKLREGALSALGIPDDSGRPEPIPAAEWVYQQFRWGDDGSRTGPGPDQTNGAGRWSALRFKRAEILTLWPALVGAGQANGVAPQSAAAVASQDDLDAVWAREYYGGWKAKQESNPGMKVPSREDDECALKSAYPNVGGVRERVRALRSENAPEWGKQGRRPGWVKGQGPGEGIE